jgi:hypothetical protein
MQNWRKENDCAACHHGPMYLWSIYTAKRQGYRVQEQQLVEMTNWMLTNDEARVFPRKERPTERTSSATDRMTTAMMGHRNLSQPTIYLTHALNLMPDQDPLKKLGWGKVVDHLAQAQSSDGSFIGRDAWRPIFNTPQILTRFVISGLQDKTSLQENFDEQYRVLKSAQSFLLSQPLDTTQQGSVLQILCEPSVPKSHSDPSLGDSNTAVKQLKRLQRPDGGWSQTDDRDSDAFATGQALAALRRAGFTSSDQITQGGIRFLLSTQMSDGTWAMTSRPNPETGKPADFLNPITYAATAWATIGLVSHVPAHESADRDATIKESSK